MTVEFEMLCNGCGKAPEELECYKIAAHESPDDPEPTAQDIRNYVRWNEGTFNPFNGHFLCDDCYISAGQPTAPGGWKAP